MGGIRNIDRGNNMGRHADLAKVHKPGERCTIAGRFAMRSCGRQSQLPKSRTCSRVQILAACAAPRSTRTVETSVDHVRQVKALMGAEDHTHEQGKGHENDP